MLKNEPKFADVAAPVPPGISWTAPEKSRPWMMPPKSVKVEEIAQQYMAALSDAKAANDVLDALDTKAPLAVIAESLMMGGVSKGYHTLDAGVMVMPVIIESLKTVAEINNIDYVVFPDELEQNTTVHPRVLKQVIDEMTNKPAQPMEEVAEEVPAMAGLMARKKEGV